MSEQESIPLLSVVVSVYNEEEALPNFWKVLKAELEQLTWRYEVIFVNDGSMDESRTILYQFAEADPTVRVVQFSKNFGHEAAMLAGIDHSKGNAVVCLDSDLQHPPSKIPEMLAAYERGYHVVNMVRTKREDQGAMKGLTVKLFYWFLNKISPVRFEANASDFFLISKKVARVLKTEYRERTRFIRGVIQIVGFEKTTVEYEAVSREEGESKYSLYKLMVLSVEAIVAFSRVPLHLGLVMGLICAVLGLGVGGYTIVMKFIDPDVPAGITTIIVLMSFLFAVLFFLIGIMGVYIGYIFEEIKRRPIYIVDEVKQQSTDE